MSAPLLAVEGLKKYFPVGRRGILGKAPQWLRAVDGISFAIQRGQSLGLVGESGCGKSTTARTIVGLHQPTSGSIRLDGIELTGLSRRAWMPHRRRVQMIFQDPYSSLNPRQNVRSILLEPMQIHRRFKPRERALRVGQLMDWVGLNPHYAERYPHEFSGGQRQRIGIARALALEPDLLICDEPVSALDVSIQSQILNLLNDLRERLKLAYLFIAHDLAVVRHLCDEVAVMYLGRIVETAPRAQLFANPRHPYTQALFSAVPIPNPQIERARERVVLPGEPPSPVNPPRGCRFHPRCPERSRVSGRRCELEEPILLPPQGPSRCACHLYD
jgi:oligopeptide/dipeptide ABC transporter ATP-binding protein